jgi:hypothetical protein
VVGGNVLLFAPAAARAAARRAAASTPAPVGATPSPAAMGKPCSCGHGKRAHEHYRRGSDCAMCSCAKYSRPFLSRFTSR